MYEAAVAELYAKKWSKGLYEEMNSLMHNDT